MQRGLDHGSDFLLGNARNATWSWCILTQPRQTEGEKMFSPQLDRRSGNSQCLRDVVVEDTIADMAGVIAAYQGNTLHENSLTTQLDELESLSDADAKRLVGENYFDNHPEIVCPSWPFVHRFTAFRASPINLDVGRARIL